MAVKKIKDLNPVMCKQYGVYSRFDEYFNLLLNAVSIKKVVSTLEDAQAENKEEKEAELETLDFEVERFIKRGLFSNGAMGYDKPIKQWFYCYGQGLNELGNPTYLTMVTANGKSFTRKAYYDKAENGAYRILATPNEISMAELIKECTNFMSNCDVAIRQNLEACKTPYVVVCKNDALRLSFEQAFEQKRNGQACVVVSEELGDGLKAVDITAEYYCDKFMQLRDKERDLLLTKLGILTANTDKAERVQGAEVYAGLGECTDYVYLLIDTFNKQMETYDIPYKMVFNGSLEEIYEENVDEEQQQQGNVPAVEDNPSDAVEKGQA